MANKTYKNPIVCKEIYLPFDSDQDDGITLDAYKEKYGIDLRDYLEFGDIANQITNRNLKTSIKIFVIDTGYYNIAIPLQIVHLDNDKKDAILLQSRLIYNEDPANVSIDGFCCIVWDYESGTLVYTEF